MATEHHNSTVLHPQITAPTTQPTTEYLNFALDNAATLNMLELELSSVRPEVTRLMRQRAVQLVTHLLETYQYYLTPSILAQTSIHAEAQNISQRVFLTDDMMLNSFSTFWVESLYNEHNIAVVDSAREGAKSLALYHSIGQIILVSDHTTWWHDLSSEERSRLIQLFCQQPLPAEQREAYARALLTIDHIHTVLAEELIHHYQGLYVPVFCREVMVRYYRSRLCRQAGLSYLEAETDRQCSLYCEEFITTYGAKTFHHLNFGTLADQAHAEQHYKRMYTDIRKQLPQFAYAIA
ncbi:MAG TPA: hypothetical protein VL461_12690 [Dictyobacter sp.]|nr:hypothetical protein [Dictyobacter sp.]